MVTNSLSRPLPPGDSDAFNFPNVDLEWVTGDTDVHVFRRPEGATMLNIQLDSGSATHFARISPLAYPGVATFSSVDVVTDIITMTAAHGFLTGDGPYQLALGAGGALTGDPLITYADANPDTITRAAGSWITDGFEPGMVITVSGSVSNNGTFTIAAGGVTATVLTLIGSDTLVAEGPTTGHTITGPDVLPSGLAVSTDYWVYVVDSDEIQLCTSYQNAVSKGTAFGYGADTPKVIDLGAGNVGSNTVLSAIPAQPTVTGTFRVATILAGVESRYHNFSAPKTFSVALSNVAARMYFWWN